MKRTRTAVPDNGAPATSTSTFDRAAGARARTRREELRLSREALATRSGLNTSNLVRWELRGIPAYLPQNEVRAWEKALQVPRGWLFEACEAEAGAIAHGDVYATAGPRARERRESLGLSCRAMAARAGVTIAALGHWERYGAPARIRDTQIAAWERALEVEPGWLLGTAAAAGPGAPGVPLVSDAADARSAIEELGNRIAAIRYETVAQGAARTEREAVSARIFSRRYGVDAPGGTALAAIGKHYGVVESRVSQILKALKTTADRLDISAPVFERIRAQAATLLPALPLDLEAHLRPLLGKGLTVEDAARFSLEVLGRPLFVFERRQFNGRPQIVAAAPEAGDAALDVLLPDAPIADAARSMIRVAGVAHMGMIKTYAAEEGWSENLIAKIRPVLEQLDGFEWLETPLAGKPQWFWLRSFASNRNLVLDATRRVLSVATGVVTFDDVVGAIARLRASRVRHGGFPPMFDIQPPPRIVFALLQRQPWLAAPSQEAGIRALRPVDPAETLAPTELVVYEALRDVGGVAPLALLTRNLVDSGVLDIENLRAALNFAPSISRPFRAVYALRGVQLDPDVFADALREGPTLTSARLPVDVDAKNGRVTFHQVINAWDLRGGWTVLPAGLVGHVPQRAYSVLPDGPIIEVKPAMHGAVRLRGISRALRARGLQVADVIKLSFDLHTSQIDIQVLPPDRFELALFDQSEMPSPAFNPET